MASKGVRKWQKAAASTCWITPVRQILQLIFQEIGNFPASVVTLSTLFFYDRTAKIWSVITAVYLGGTQLSPNMVDGSGRKQKNEPKEAQNTPKLFGRHYNLLLFLPWEEAVPSPWTVIEGTIFQIKQRHTLELVVAPQRCKVCPRTAHCHSLGRTTPKRMY